MKRHWILLVSLLLVSVCAGTRQPEGQITETAAKTAAVPEDEIKYVALTFDDGPSPRCTPQLLDGLKARNVHATFFVVGCQVV